MEDKRTIYIIQLYPNEDTRMVFARDYNDAEFHTAIDIFEAMKKIKLLHGFIIREIHDENTDPIFRQ